MFKIGEFSRLGQVSIRMLRHYDETGLLKPNYTEGKSGYRFYSGDQLHILHRIVFLRDAGFKIAEIDELLRNWDENHLEERLGEKRAEALVLIEKENGKIALIDNAIASLKKRTLPMDFPVVVKDAPGRLVASLRGIIPGYFAKRELWRELYRLIGENGLAPSLTGERMGIYHDEEYKESDVDLEACAMLKDNASPKKDGIEVKYTDPIEQLACVMVYGPFENTVGAYESLASWLQERDSFKMLGFSRQINHAGPWNENDPDKYLTEIQIPITTG